MDNSMVQNERTNPLDETRIRTKDSKNMAMAFKGLSINPYEDLQQNHPLSMISPIN